MENDRGNPARKRHYDPVDHVYQDAKLTLDFLCQRVYVRGVEIELTKTEFDILALLVSHKGQPVNQQRILRHVWRAEEYGADKRVNWHCSNLRRKLGSGLIVSRRNFGYSYEGQDETDHR